MTRPEPHLDPHAGCADQGDPACQRDGQILSSLCNPPQSHRYGGAHLIAMAVSISNGTVSSRSP